MLLPFPQRAASRLLWMVLVGGTAAWLLGEQGARVGPWPCPLWDWSWLLLAGLGAFALAPGARAPLPRRSVALVALALLATAWPVDGWRLEARRSAFTITGDVRALSAATPQPERVVGLRSLRLPRRGVVRRLLGRGEDLRLDVRGFVYVPTTGRHRFEAKADDACTLRIDGQEVTRPGEDAADVELQRGSHAFELTYVQERGAASLLVGWDRPDLLELLPLEHYLSDHPDEVTPRRLLRKRVKAMGALALAWGWLAAASALVVRAGEAKRAWWSAHVRPRLAPMTAALRADPHVKPAALAFLGAAALLLAAETVGRRLAPPGFYLQAYTSEYLMQTVSVADLRDEPLRSLWYLHIQPPLLDALRAALAQLSPGADGDVLMRRVDAGLYVLWGGAYALLVALVCLWLRRTTTRRFALAAAAVFALHPASLFYATLLDSTLLSSLGVAWLLYELWRARAGGGSMPRVGLAVLVLFFTRSVFQWPFLVVVLLSLALLRVPWRRLVLLAAAVSLVMGAYMAKQYALFGITFTSSFAADNFCKGLHEYCEGRMPAAVPELPDPARARVLSRTAKLDGEYNYNQIAFLRRSFSQMAEYKWLLRTRTRAQNAEALRRNVVFWLRPSSRYTEHALIDRLPWRGAFDAVFSGACLVALWVLATSVWLIRSDRRGRRAGLALALPCAYVLAVSLLFEGGENMRFKFFLEPVLFVFLAAQAHALAGVGQRLLRARGLGFWRGADGRAA